MFTLFHDTVHRRLICRGNPMSSSSCGPQKGLSVSPRLFPTVGHAGKKVFRRRTHWQLTVGYILFPPGLPNLKETTGIVSAYAKKTTVNKFGLQIHLSVAQIIYVRFRLIGQARGRSETLGTNTDMKNLLRKDRTQADCFI